MVRPKSSRLGRSAIWCNPSKPVNPILSNFAPLNPILFWMISNSGTCLLRSFHTSALNIDRAKLAGTQNLANLDSWVQQCCRCLCRCRPRCHGSTPVPIVGSPILQGWICLCSSNLGTSLYPSKRSLLQNALFGSYIPQNWMCTTKCLIWILYSTKNWSRRNHAQKRLRGLVSVAPTSP